ncbi:hypothetical protein ACQJBY_068229 [Aegilops geniculata]
MAAGSWIHSSPGRWQLDPSTSCCNQGATLVLVPIHILPHLLPHLPQSGPCSSSSRRGQVTIDHAGDELVLEPAGGYAARSTPRAEEAASNGEEGTGAATSSCRRRRRRLLVLQPHILFAGTGRQKVATTFHRCWIRTVSSSFLLEPASFFAGTC